MTAIQRFSGVRGRWPQPRDLACWCACALVLLAPGSFVIVPLVWLVRRAACKVSPPHMTGKS
jgi:hypothetical protein